PFTRQWQRHAGRGIGTLDRVGDLRCAPRRVHPERCRPADHGARRDPWCGCDLDRDAGDHLRGSTRGGRIRVPLAARSTRLALVCADGHRDHGHRGLAFEQAEARSGVNVLSADLGGTSVRVVLYVDRDERGRAEAPGGPMRTGQGTEIAARLASLARPLLSREGVVRADAFVVGAAGAGRESERTELERALSEERIAWQVMVVTDAELARAAAFEGGPGVLLIAGTGSIAIGADAQGRVTRVGGLGWRLGDQGSAHWLGARALEAIGAMNDRIGPVTHLAERIPAAVGVAGIAGLVRWSTTATV